MLKLNIGSGHCNGNGFTPVDRKLGSEAYPLGYDDASVDVIRASHVLEHFSHRDVSRVLSDWHRALKPGGKLLVAVPNFEWIARKYLDGEKINVQGYTMGGHVDQDDRHGTIFDRESLCEALGQSGFDVTGDWVGDMDDCSTLPVSLNIAAVKNGQDSSPSDPVKTKVSAVMSVPRLGFMDNFFSAMRALPPLGIELRKVTGAYWDQCMERGIEQALERDKPDLILTLDYDTVFSKQDVAAMIDIMNRNPHIDALAPIQANRGTGLTLMTVKDGNGKNRHGIRREELEAETIQVSTAHFGLTLIRSDALKKLKKPWFKAETDPRQAWGEGRTDPDVFFWQWFENEGFKLHQANRVAVGHLEMMVCWPDHNLQTIYQHPSDYQTGGKPQGAWQ